MINEDNLDIQKANVLGQKYAYATVSLILGIACFINMLGLEKGILTLVFAWLALKSHPQPSLSLRRTWAKIGLALGIIMVVMVPTFLILYADRFREFITALQRVS